MLSRNDILETIRMIDQQHLDIRTITMGISLLSCADSSAERACEKIYDKISRYAERLVATGEEIEREFGIPIVNKRVSVTPIALVAAASETEDYVPFAKALDRAAKNVGVNFIGGFSALVQKGMTDADRKLIAAIPEALACTDLVCSSVNVGSSKAGINMDAVALMGQTVKKTAALTEKQGGFGCAKLVIFCNAVEDNPFMAGAFHGVAEGGLVHTRRTGSDDHAVKLVFLDGGDDFFLSGFRAGVHGVGGEGHIGIGFGDLSDLAAIHGPGDVRSAVADKNAYFHALASSVASSALAAAALAACAASIFRRSSSGLTQSFSKPSS